METEERQKADEILKRLQTSDFRRKFRLGEKEKAYIKEKGMAVIRNHAEDFIEKRLAPAYPKNDGKQTPMRGHPVFLAQHATATCCRGCLHKWHRIAPGKELSAEEQKKIVDLILRWIETQFTQETK